MADIEVPANWGALLASRCTLCPMLPISSASAISVSFCCRELLALLCFRTRRGATRRVGAVSGGCVAGFGGPGAIGTTVFTGLSAGPELVGVLAAEPPPDLGESDSLARLFPVAGVPACTTEFLRLTAFLERDDPTGTVLPLPRLRFLMTSVFKLNGRTTPCSLRKSPQALHSGWPSGLRRHKGVVCVKQLVHVVGTPLFSPPGRGLPGRDGAADVKPDSGGDAGDVCVRIENMPVAIPTVFGVDVVRGIFRVLGSPPRFLMSLTDAAEPCPLLRLP